MKARPERVPASSSSSASLGAGGELAQHPVEAALEEERRVAEDRVRLHQPARRVERAGVADAAERRRPPGRASPAMNRRQAAGVDRRHRQLVDEDPLLREQVQHVLGRLQHLREAVVAERRLQRAEALAVVGVAREVERPHQVGPARPRRRLLRRQQRQRGLRRPPPAAPAGGGGGAGGAAGRLRRRRLGRRRRRGAASASAAPPRSAPGRRAAGRAARRGPGRAPEHRGLHRLAGSPPASAGAVPLQRLAGRGQRADQRRGHLRERRRRSRAAARAPRRARRRARPAAAAAPAPPGRTSRRGTACRAPCPPRRRSGSRSP